jgi:signal transduction histidine kinase
MSNLVGNACKFSPAGGAVAIGRSLSDERRPFFVQDHGIGFDPAFAEKVFLPFERLHHEGEYPGTGIGLATVKRIILRHGGQVWVQTWPDEGTTVYFTLDGETAEAKVEES